MGFGNNKSAFNKFGAGVVGSHERGLPAEGVSPRGAVLAEGNLQAPYRFFLEIRGVDVAYIVNVSRPSYTIQTQDAKLLNWSFSYPTNITWEPISFSIRELFEGYTFTSILGLFYGKLVDYGWDPPTELTKVSPVLNSQNKTYGKDLSKSVLKESLGPVKIKSLNDEGQVVETWELHGAFVTSVKPSRLSYSEDGLTNIDVGIKYDFATLEVADAVGVFSSAARAEVQSL
jgi:hypothetical protein